MRTASSPAKPMFAPLRAVSDVLDDVEVELEVIQRDMVVVERAGSAVLVGCALALAVVVVLVVRRSRRRPESAPPATAASEDTVTDDG